MRTFGSTATGRIWLCPLLDARRNGRFRAASIRPAVREGRKAEVPEVQQATVTPGWVPL